MDVTHEIPSVGGMPKLLGPYSQVVRAGDFLFVAGQSWNKSRNRQGGRT